MRKYTYIIVIFFLYFLSASITFAADLTWNQNQDAAYYKICWGTDPDDDFINCSDEIDSQTTAFTLVETLQEDSFYYAIQAFNACGNSSDFSDKVLGNGVPQNQAESLIVSIKNDGQKTGVAFKLYADSVELDGTYGMINTYCLEGTAITVVGMQGSEPVEGLTFQVVMNQNRSLTLDYDSLQVHEEGNSGVSNDNPVNTGGVGAASLSSGAGAGGGGCFISSLF